MPVQRLMELIIDRGIESRMAGELRVFFQPGMSTPEEMSLITRKLEAAVQRMREIDPVDAAVFADTFHKVYVVPQPNAATTSSGMPKLPQAFLVHASISIIAAFLVQYVPLARAGLIRAVFQLVDPVPILIAMREAQITFVRAAEPDTPEAREFIRSLEGKIAVLRPQLRRE